MTTPGLVFLSAVTSEFGRARDQVAKDLRKNNKLDVKVQEEFPLTSGTLVDALDDYIETCTAVYAIVGQRSGSVPPATASEPFHDDLPPELVEKSGTEWSYTQWEVFLAVHHGKPLFLFRASKQYQPDEAEPPKGDDPKLQKRFRKWLFGKKKGTGRNFRTFDNVDRLLVAALTTTLDGERVEAETGEFGASAREKRSRGRSSRKLPEKQNRMNPGAPLVDRREDLSWIITQIAEARKDSAAKLVMLKGEEGVGRRTILRALSHSHSAGLPTFPDGVAVHPVLTEQENLEDLRQAIWEQFYVGADPSTVRKRSRVQQLKSVEALVFLPGTDRFAGLIEQISKDMPKSVICTWVTPDVASRIAGRRITIDRLPREQMVGDVATCPVLDLFEARYGAAVPEAARDDVLALCDEDRDRHLTGACGHPKKIEILAQDAHDETRGSADRLAGWAQERVEALSAARDREASSR